MPRSKRTVIDSDLPLVNNGYEWMYRDASFAFSEDPIAPEDDWLTVDTPTVFGSGGATYEQVTIWGHGLITLGAPTSAQLAYMATLSSLPATGADLFAFLAAFPGDFINIGFTRDPYGQVEAGERMRDPIANPFGSYDDIQVPPTSGQTVYRWDEASRYVHVGVAGTVLEGSVEDYDFILPFFGETHGAEFSDEGFQVEHAGAWVQFGGASLTVGDNAFVYYSDLNVVQLRNRDDVATITGSPEALLGAGGDDRLTGGTQADRLEGDMGDDVLVGGGGVDRLYGGSGADDLADGDERGSLTGGAGDDILRPGLGEDTVDGGDGVDRLIADYSAWTTAITFVFDPAVADYLFPDAYKRVVGVEAITFTAGAGHDTLAGASGRDVLAGGAGADVLLGNRGDDRLSGGDARDRLEGGAGDDVLDGGTGVGPTEVDSSGSPSYDLDGDPDLLLHVHEVENGSIGGDPVYGWQPSFSFTVADPASQHLALDFGLIAGDVQGYVSSYTTSIYRIEDNGDYTYVTGESTDGSNPIDYLFDAPGRYVLYIYTNDDDPAELTVGVRLTGVAARGGDTMVGGTGDDTYLVDSLDDQVVENAREGTDTVVTALARYSLAALPEVERLVGARGAQTLTGNALANTIVGGGGHDTLAGGGGRDQLVIAAVPAHVDGGGGVDRLVVADGASVALRAGLVDRVEEFAVGDRGTLDLSAFAASPGAILSLSTAAGGATIVGSRADDLIRGGAGADKLSGDNGDDVILLTHQARAVDGGGGTDTLALRGAPGTAYAFTAGHLAYTELVTVGGGIVLDLTGLANAPGKIRLLDGARVTGSDGDDQIVGSRGADVIAGGRGADLMTGGGGADRFVFRSVADTPAGEAGRDRVLDFHHAQGDRLDVSALGDGFRFIGGSAFSGAAATGEELRVVVTGSGASVVQIDLDHDARVDASFVVEADAPLTAGDFVF